MPASGSRTIELLAAPVAVRVACGAASDEATLTPVLPAAVADGWPQGFRSGTARRRYRIDVAVTAIGDRTPPRQAVGYALNPSVVVSAAVGRAVAINAASVRTFEDNDTTGLADHFSTVGGGFHVVQSATVGREMHLYVDEEGTPRAATGINEFTFDLAFAFPVTVFDDFDIESPFGTVERLTDYGLRWQVGAEVHASNLGFNDDFLPPAQRAFSRRDVQALTVVEVSRTEGGATITDLTIGSHTIDALRVYTFVTSAEPIVVHRLFDVDSDFVDTDDTVQRLAGGALFTTDPTRGLHATGMQATPAPAVLLGVRDTSEQHWESGSAANPGASRIANNDVAAVLRWSLPAGTHRIDQLLVHEAGTVPATLEEAVQTRLVELDSVRFTVRRVWAREVP